MLPAKTQISRNIRPVLSGSSLLLLAAKDPRFLHADSEDSDQTGLMPRLICVFAGLRYFVGFAMLRLISGAIAIRRLMKGTKEVRTKSLNYRKYDKKGTRQDAIEDFKLLQLSDTWQARTGAGVIIDYRKISKYLDTRKTCYNHSKV